MLAASDQMRSDLLDDYILVGELALTGGVRHVKGVLPIAWRARAEGNKGVLVPVLNSKSFQRAKIKIRQLTFPHRTENSP